MSDLDEPPRTPRRAGTRQRASYRLDVIGIHVADVVNSAGGWLFDRVMAGWDVRVAVSEDSDMAALQILGVRTADLATIVGNGEKPLALAVAGSLCGADERVGDVVTAAARSTRTEVTVWGEFWVPGMRRTGNEVRHELSAAARVFKAQAVLAAGAGPTAPGAYEMFRSHGRTAPTEYPDLLPVR
ncbi:hypothetical protein ACXDF8_20180 [Mycolicibacterium sp. CBM1]